ncbi:MAG: UDP-3-O-(3-hydroxymyristoyl)glucosamine N-acyltransferase [Myxococcota bacterium]|nr:UDP-3-O-(3-hydroxymyristoyl)glucosamine N-acyltransferase [Myxococcota bacterium]
MPTRIASVRFAAAGDIAPVLAPRWRSAARDAALRGAALLVDASLVGSWLECAREVWTHDDASWAMAGLLDDALVPPIAAVLGDGCHIGANVVLGPRVVVGARVTIGPGAVIGSPGFGWVRGLGGGLRAVPQLAGVVIEDDVAIGPLCTIDAGTLSPTRIRRNAKLDAHIHVGHNGDVGEGTLVAAQSGFAGSVTIGREVLIGGQVGVADHVTIGDRARIAAKSGVIGDVPAGATVAGYPAVARVRWLRALATMQRALRPTGKT